MRAHLAQRSRVRHLRHEGCGGCLKGGDMSDSAIEGSPADGRRLASTGAAAFTRGGASFHSRGRSRPMPRATGSIPTPPRPKTSCSSRSIARRARSRSRATTAARRSRCRWSTRSPFARTARSRPRPARNRRRGGGRARDAVSLRRLRNKPYCDGSHVGAGFVATGEPATKPSEPLAARDGALKITPYPNGPLKSAARWKSSRARGA